MSELIDQLLSESIEINPENKNALRNNLAQQIKHKELVNLQYNK